MREILFRGRQTDKDKWIYGVPVKGTSIDESEILIIESVFKCEEYACRGCEFTPVIPKTVGQYTGVNVGREKLFEGDIVEWHEDYDDTWGYSQTTVGRSVVVWDTDNFCWAFKTDNEYVQAFNDWSWNSSYIIGNIHDNPELLKGGAEE